MKRKSNAIDIATFRKKKAAAEQRQGDETEGREVAEDQDDSESTEDDREESESEQVRKQEEPAVSTVGPTAFTSDKGFKNWQKAIYKDGGFAAHAKSEAHTTAIWAEYEKSATGKSSVLSSL
ncbi:hypothetical protein AAFF_G00213690 [Aldrovandia affinis]|uniref:Uncharacterized protein n=1 Tax=Aldrovandia affinis TaxID=143900 RepID=A0AAD7W4G3_9TELE|nr:hypothetical protein AAFF_G00213690 [Aldrovandia affinis]